jgi:hypothetical protein
MLVLLGAVMKKTALALALIIWAIFSLLAVESQTIILVRGNAVWPIGSIHIDAQEAILYSSTITLSYSAVFPSDFGISALGRKWIVYSLDGAENVTVYDEYNALKFYNGSFTLSGLSSGLHHIDIYSKNGTFMWGTPSLSGWCDAEDTASFTIDLSGKSPTPTPQLAEQEAILGIAVTVTVVCVGLGLLFYLIKRK